VIGGGGERKTLRLVARYADACNLLASSPDEIAHKLDVLRRHCAREGRDPESVDKTIMAVGNPFDDVDGFLASMANYAKLGVGTIALIPSGDPIAFAARSAEELVPRLAELNG
jgi:alkanesulfonate monooxygenase SsuD/methylene tetrahydromethanopterin reductase-like flavin-dependent oxidoreductase (luciferase family)